MNDELIFALWFIPEKQVNEALHAMIVDLAHRFGASPFPAHMTGFAGTFRRVDDPAQHLEEVLEGMGSFSLPVTGPGQSDYFFKTFFIELAANPAVEAVHRSLWERTGKTSNYVLKPHVSLLYKEMSARERATLVAETPLVWDYLRFDEAWLVHPRNRERGWRDMANLEFLCKKKIRTGD